MNEFNLDTAILLSNLSVRAYREPEKIKTEDLDLELVSYFDVAKTHTNFIFSKMIQTCISFSEGLKVLEM